MLSYCYNMMNRLRIAEGSKILIPNTDSFFFKQKTAYEISACLVGSEICIRDRFSEMPSLELFEW